MFLSRLMLNPRSRPVRHDLHDCNQLKRTVLHAFPETDTDQSGARDQFGVLYRLDLDPRSGIPGLIVQSRIQPDWASLAGRDQHYLIDEPQCKDVSGLYSRLEDGQELRFRLRANPTMRLARGADHKLAGKRVDLRTDEERLDWLQRKAAQSGFDLVDVRTIPDLSASIDVYGLTPDRPRRVPDVRDTPGATVTGLNGDKQKMTFATVVFDGYLRISDRAAFRSALESGIGPAKAYGFGLLSIAPVR